MYAMDDLTPALSSREDSSACIYASKEAESKIDL